MKWILPYETYFDEDKLMSLGELKPIELICGSVNQYTIPNPDHVYIISVDCQEEGADSNALVVFDLNEREIASE